MEATITVRDSAGAIKAEAKALKTGEVILAWEGEYVPGDEIVFTFPETETFYVVRVDDAMDESFVYVTYIF